MGLERNLRRQKKRMAAKGDGHPAPNPFDQLRDAIGGLDQIQKVLMEIKDLQGKFKEALGYVEVCKEELARQRVVCLRFLTQPEPLMGPRDNAVDKHFSAERQYRAEYDALLLFVKLLTWVKETP